MLANQSLHHPTAVGPDSPFPLHAAPAWRRAAHRFAVRLHGVALLETLGLLSALLVADLLLGGEDRFIGVTPHPFWLVVLLVTVQYGPAEGLGAAALAGVFLLAGNLPAQQMSETWHQYLFRVLSLPLLWLATALLLGALRARQLHERRLLLGRTREAEQATHAIATAYAELRKTKERLELRLAGERRSALTICLAAIELEGATAADLPAVVCKLVDTVLGPRKYSLFIAEAGGLRLAAARGWDADDRARYAARFDRGAPLVRALKRGRGRGRERGDGVVCVRRKGDEVPLAQEGVLAALIRDEKSGRVFGMLKIEDMDLRHLGTTTQATCRSVCAWVGSALARRQREAGPALDAPGLDSRARPGAARTALHERQHGGDAVRPD